MKKRVLAALLVTVMAVATAAGCGSSSKSDNSDKKTEATDKTEDKEKVVVVTAGTGEPYSLLSDDGKTWTGIDHREEVTAPALCIHGLPRKQEYDGRMSIT